MKINKKQVAVLWIGITFIIISSFVIISNLRILNGRLEYLKLRQDMLRRGAEIVGSNMTREDHKDYMREMQTFDKQQTQLFLRREKILILYYSLMFALVSLTGLGFYLAKAK